MNLAFLMQNDRRTLDVVVPLQLTPALCLLL